MSTSPLPSPAHLAFDLSPDYLKEEGEKLKINPLAFNTIFNVFLADPK